MPTSALSRRIPRTPGASTSSLAASRARESPSRAISMGSPIAAPRCGRTLQGYLAFFDPGSSSSRTATLCECEDSTESSQTLPRSGLMRSGTLSPLPTSAHRTCGEGYSLWPTPTASDAKRARMALSSLAKAYWKKKAGRRRGKQHHGSSILGETLAARFGLRQGGGFTEWLMGFPQGWTGVDCELLDQPLFRALSKRWGDD
jgi:hypothetical protein